jgi:hypothetical protein
MAMTPIGGIPIRTTSHHRRLPGAAPVALAAVAVSAAAITGLSATAANAAPTPNPPGHVPQEAPQALAQTVIDVDRF